MNSQKLISTIKNAKSMNDIPLSYYDAVKLIHPDICSLPEAQFAFTKLTQLKNDSKYGIKSLDDAGEYKYTATHADFFGDINLLKLSQSNFLALQKKVTDAFQPYIPQSMEFIKNMGQDVNRVKYARRAIPLSAVPTLEHVHINWILSRLLEYCIYINDIGYIHGGLNIDSVFITPEDHGIQVMSYYHTTPIDFKIKTISAKYKHWYPSYIFKDKIAIPEIDLHCIKSIIIYLLGDKTGNGAILRKKSDVKLMEFLDIMPMNTIEAFKQYRDFLQKNFEKKFYLLEI